MEMSSISLNSVNSIQPTHQEKKASVQVGPIAAYCLVVEALRSTAREVTVESKNSQAGPQPQTLGHWHSETKEGWLMTHTLNGATVFERVNFHRKVFTVNGKVEKEITTGITLPHTIPMDAHCQEPNGALRALLQGKKLGTASESKRLEMHAQAAAKNGNALHALLSSIQI